MTSTLAGADAAPRTAEGSAELLIGCYTGASCKGIGRYRFDLTSGQIQAQPLEVIETDNPSWVTLSADGRQLFAVNENGPASADPVGRASSFALARGPASSRRLSQANSLGDDPAHASVSRDGRYLFVANYSGAQSPGGTLAVLPIDREGRLQPGVQVLTHRASLADRERQLGPHVHAVVPAPDGRYVLAADLGADKVYVYRYDPARSAERPLLAAATASVDMPPGSGPRHLLFDDAGKHVYLTLEMTGELVVFDYDDGRLQPVQTVAMDPGRRDGNAAAALHLSDDGRFLYASNRGEDNHIAVYAVDAANGQLTAMQRRSTEGRGPREFALSPDGRHVVVANQHSNTLVVIERDPRSGRLGDTVQTMEAVSPSDVKFVPVE
ncbi:lactonase family protein [Lysobacter capsici]|uniref:lactonase family protein n=1 Tax=Lysobacter capsici TaxID=435897 RepID=UPI00287BAADF|nr:lactonase family protein [Lysobacter capsici]WND81386.1 lactonase family protein [Lysobacter capsici]WND86582.1 lactonase family protein [Lysobacter capsici]